MSKSEIPPHPAQTTCQGERKAKLCSLDRIRSIIWGPGEGDGDISAGLQRVQRSLPVEEMEGRTLHAEELSTFFLQETGFGF